jgi:hypothetical protein
MCKLSCTTQARCGALRATTLGVVTASHRAARSAEPASASLMSNAARRRCARQRWRGHAEQRKATCIGGVMLIARQLALGDDQICPLNRVKPTAS